MKECNSCGVQLGQFCKPGSYCPACHATHEHIVDATKPKSVEVAKTDKKKAK